MDELTFYRLNGDVEGDRRRRELGISLYRAIAHDMKTPLQILKNNLDYLSSQIAREGDREGDADELEEVLHENRTSVDRLAKLAGYALTLDVESPPVPHRIRMESIIGRIKEETLREGQGRISLSFTSHGDDPRLWGGENELDLILRNLVVNSMEALKNGSPGGMIEVRAVTADSRFVLSVEDDGPGLDGEIVPRLFQKGETTKKGSAGNGLGLYLTKRIVEDLFRGTLDFDHPRGRGARFTMILPLAREEMVQ